MNKKVSRKARLNPVAPLFILFLMIVIVIGTIVMMFIVYVNDDIKIDRTVVMAADKPSSAAPSSAPAASGGAGTSSEPPTSSGDTPSSEAPLPPVDPLKTVVAESASVEKSYFDDAVFIGDSISKGLKLSGVLPPANVVADQNVGIDQIANGKPVYMNSSGTKVTLFDALKAVPVKVTKVYIMLGSNGLPHYDNTAHMKYYDIVLDKIIKTYPDATIYVQSVTPITAQAEKDYAKKRQVFTNAKINEFNELVLKMCEKKGVYYLSVRDALTDENGQAKANFASGDGVHFTKSGHEAMYQYYKTHTVPKVMDNNAE